ncbi:MAG: hypothetical protein ACREXR_01360 [Gammaproteobacteria bacterium]
MNDAWRVTAQTSASRWLEVPVRIDDPKLWADDVARDLVRDWGKPESEKDVISSLLTAAWVERDSEAIINLLFLPVSGPIIGRVSIAIRRFDGLGIWLDRGYVLSEWEAENIGPGMKCVYVEESSRPRFVASAFVFKNGGHAVVVSVAPSLPLVYDAMTPDLYSIIDAVEVLTPEGLKFVSEPIGEVAHGPLDVWMGESV